MLPVQSYSGGRDLWGLHDSTNMVERPEEVEKGFTKPIFDDGLLEVIGLKSGWHTYACPLTKQARRLAECALCVVVQCWHCVPCLWPPAGTTGFEQPVCGLVIKQKLMIDVPA